MSMEIEAAVRERDAHEHDVVMPGFRFHPTEEELVAFYLRRKVQGKSFNVELITVVDLYRYEPWELPAMAVIGEKEWFFYVPRDRKYRNGDRPNRVTASGYWKATGASRMIRSENSQPIGVKKTLVFYTGKAPKGIRTSWIMNEYRLPPSETDQYQKVELSICRVYKRGKIEDHRRHALSFNQSPSRETVSDNKKKKIHERSSINGTFAEESSSSPELEKVKDQVAQLTTPSKTLASLEQNSLELNGIVGDKETYLNLPSSLTSIMDKIWEWNPLH
ncbi:NAC domain-containing protein 35-like [Typha latifolia]|uniref:NAC domain-containing protein 35-like n=1 Tax=Typha latifolia TaxID=4733 RepID=UPI003C2E5BF0